MKPPAYARPDTLDEALVFLKTHGAHASPLAGGTDVMVDLRSGELNTSYLLDISRLKDLRGIALTKEGLVIGAGVTISEIYASTLIAEHAPSLLRACASFGSPQIRNAATIGGNVVNASPSADTAPSLLVHEARALLASDGGERTVYVADLFEGSYKSGIRPDELLIRFILGPAKGGFTDFQKIGRRKALAISRMSMAVLAESIGTMGSAGTFGTVRLALGSATPTPMRMTAVESLLSGKPVEQRIIHEGARLMAKEMVRITGRRPSTVYKEKAVQGLFLRIMEPLLK